MSSQAVEFITWLLIMMFRLLAESARSKINGLMKFSRGKFCFVVCLVQSIADTISECVSSLDTAFEFFSMEEVNNSKRTCGSVVFNQTRVKSSQLFFMRTSTHFSSEAIVIVRMLGSIGVMSLITVLMMSMVMVGLIMVMMMLMMMFGTIVGRVVMLVMFTEMVLSGMDEVGKSVFIEPVAMVPSSNISSFVSEFVSNFPVAFGIFVDEIMDRFKGGTSFFTEMCLDTLVDMMNLGVD